MLPSAIVPATAHRDRRPPPRSDTPASRCSARYNPSELFSPSSKARLTDHDLDRFPGRTLFDRIARATCHAGCLPRKELYEAWEVARRVRRICRGGRIVDLAAGHG